MYSTPGNPRFIIGMRSDHRVKYEKNFVYLEHLK